VGRYATHGCIRLHNEHVERLFREVPDGTLVAIVREPVRIARSSDDRLFLEVHDAAPTWSLAALRRSFRRHGLEHRVDWEKAEAALDGRWGVAVEVSSTANEPQS
jgi:hypothetical protein